MDARQRLSTVSECAAVALQPTATQAGVLVLADVDVAEVRALLATHGIGLVNVAEDAPIPGTYWGEPEAGVIGAHVYARTDTPVHSVLHEACHLMVAPIDRRDSIHTDASDSQSEEDAACYLQVLLADQLRNVGRMRLMTDMDTWGYSFRLGCARAWFEHDADDARGWLMQRGLLPRDST